MNGAADIITDSVAISFNENDASKRNYIRIDSGVTLPCKTAKRRMPVSIPVIWRISCCFHVEHLDIVSGKARRIIQSFPDIAVYAPRPCQILLSLESFYCISRALPVNTVSRSGIVSMQKKLVLKKNDLFSRIAQSKGEIPRRVSEAGEQGCRGPSSN